MKRFSWLNVSRAYLGLCILLGGASAAGALANMFLQIVALGVLLGLVWSGQARLPAGSLGIAFAVGAMALFGVLSLVPLPPGLLNGLPLRDELAAGIQLLGFEAAWLPLSLAPAATLGSLLWLLPPVTMFLLAVNLTASDRWRLQSVVIVAAICSALLGTFQLAGGVASPLRVYEITNPNMPVGVFANVNHQATLLLCALPLLAATAARNTSKAGGAKRSGSAIMSIAVALFLTVAIALTGSMAGFGLFLVAALASILIYRRSAVGRLSRGAAVAILVLTSAFMVASMIGPLSDQRLSSEFADDPASRAFIASTTMEAIEDSFPAGTGLGTFSDIYPRYEDTDRPLPDFTNHAHNDYLEFTLEMGFVGILLIASTLFWWFRRSLRAWADDFKGAGLARAACVIIAIVLLHSIVDYPLRTTAVGSIFAMACAFMVPVAGRVAKSPSSQSEVEGPVRHLQAD